MSLSRLTAGDLCVRHVAVARRSTALDEAARLMRGEHVGCLVVVDETPQGRIVAGMLTDRDIVTSVVARDVAPASLRVGDVMNEDAVCVREDDTLPDVLATMQRHRVRRLPVLDARQALVGIVAADDLLHTLAGELQTLTRAIDEQVRNERRARP